MRKYWHPNVRTFLYARTEAVQVHYRKGQGYRRAPLEEPFLNDLMNWILHTGVKGCDRSLTRYVQQIMGTGSRAETERTQSPVSGVLPSCE